MMSKRLYYDDAYTTEFTAVVVEQLNENGRLAVVLDRTFFYPTSGGQPHDLGSLNGVPVTDVSIRVEDGAVLHWLEPGRSVSHEITAEIDWGRRFDHMQQHTGQHILSQAFIQVAGAHTVGFHLSQSTVTIDLDARQLSEATLQKAEQLANQIVWENRPVHIRTVSVDEARQMPLRKVPPTRDGRLRLIDIDRFDLTACGGTHVSRTGEIGMIKLLKWERRRQQTRVTFCCGGRALQDYGQKNALVHELMAALTTGQGDLVPSIGRLRDDLKQARRQLKKQQTALLEFEAERLHRDGMQRQGITVVAQVFTDRDPGQLRMLGNLLTRKPGVVALLGLAGSRSHLLFCRSEDAPGEMNQLLQQTITEIGSRTGGGSEVFAQGGGPAADVHTVNRALQHAAAAVFAQR